MSACCLFNADTEILNEYFYNDLASENNRLGGQLYLDHYNYDLTSLTYSAYIAHLDTSVKNSAKGLTAKIRKADNYYFKTNSDAFLLLLEYRTKMTIVGDKSNTSFLDTIIITSHADSLPSLEQLGEKISF